MHDETGTMRYSMHAKARQQQRSIMGEAVDLLLDFGRPKKAGKGAESYSFDRRSWRAASRYLGPHARLFEKYRNA